MPRQAPENSCTTCRQRKIRCDGALPECQNCLKSKRSCTRSRESETKYIIYTDNPGLERSILTAQDNRAANDGHDSEELQQAQSTVSKLPSLAIEEPIIATLFRHYIDVLASWYDLNDTHSTFKTLVPFRSLQNAVLFKALIAFSACHVSRTTGRFLNFGSVYHSSCVEGLLAALDDPSLELQEDYLAATCLLRSYEILTGDMRRHQDHLLGAYSFATNRPINLTARGLAQSGTWNYLREEITVALESRRLVRFSEGFNFVPTAEMSDDQCANAITFILARTINLCFSDITHQNIAGKSENWHKLVADVKSWRHGLSDTFKPFSTASKPGNVFPSIWLLQPWHVAAEQYYSVTEILLALCQPAPVDALQADRDLESIVEHTLRICGIAYTNDDVSARVNAFGPLAFCGRYLTEAKHRSGLIDMLKDFSKPTGWPVDPILEELQRHWAEEDGLW